MTRKAGAIEIRRVDGGAGLADARVLFREFASALGRDLSFQDFARELSDLPGEYGPPLGALLLARFDGRLAGCVALRPLGGEGCEMRRLFVRHQFRGKGVGKRLALAVIEAAREAGHPAIRLGLATWMDEAIAIYRALGFRPIDPYRVDGVNGFVFMELPLH